MAGYRDVLQAFADANVTYVVVGGTAVALQGHLRQTVDLDVVVELVPEATRAAIDCLSRLGFVPRLPVDPQDFSDDKIRRTWVEERNLMVFSMFDPTDPLREVDVFATYPLDFPQLLARSRLLHLNGVPVRVAAIEDLITMKEAAGRPHDLLDVAELRILLEEEP